MTPDEKRKECGQELVNKYFNPKVAAAPSAPSTCLSSFPQRKLELSKQAFASLRRLIPQSVRVGARWEA